MGYDLQRYSKLTKINKDNVKKLVQQCGAS
jgi:glucose dehydrogenase